MFKKIAIAAAFAASLFAGAAHADALDDVMMPKLAGVVATVNLYDKLCPTPVPATMLTLIKTVSGKVDKKAMVTATDKTKDDVTRVGIDTWCGIVGRTMFKN